MPDDLTKQDDLLNHDGLSERAPFVIEHRQEERGQGGTFRPSARLVLTNRVRTSGLWRSLTPEDFKTLLLLFTYVSPNGWCRPTLPELAEAMEVSHGKAKGRMERLVRTSWQGQPLATLLARPDGLDAYLPGRRLVDHEEIAEPEPPQAAPLRTPGREAVVAYSRARYAKTREEVERQIGEMMGWTPPDFAGEDPAVAEGKRRAFQALTDAGCPRGRRWTCWGASTWGRWSGRSPGCRAAVPRTPPGSWPPPLRGTMTGRRERGARRQPSAPEGHRSRASGTTSRGTVSKEAGWHPVPVRLVDEVMPDLRDTELRVLLVVLRQTWGWRADRLAGSGAHKRRDWLSHRQLCRRTGRGSDAVSAAVASLTAAGLIVVEDGGGRPLAMPEERRRCLGRLYFRPGEMWTDGSVH